MERAKAAVDMNAPAIHTTRHPNLFVSALTTGPALRYIPDSREPTQAVVLFVWPYDTMMSGMKMPKV